MRSNAPYVHVHLLTERQTSSGFFDASKSFVRITQTLEATCDVNFTTCNSAMNDFAKQLVLDSNCQVDYSNNNPQVLQAYNGLLESVSMVVLEAAAVVVPDAFSSFPRR